jgi:hypothetical protein
MQEARRGGDLGEVGLVSERLAEAMAPLAEEVLGLWDAAEGRAERATLVPLLQRFVAVPAVEDRMARDYLHSLRAGDRHLAAILQTGSDRVVAAYAQVVLRRLRHGRGLARYAVRHLARRGDGLGLLRAVVVSDRFAPRDVLTVLEAHPHRDLWVRALPRLARNGSLPPTDDDGLAACLDHPDGAVRDLARQRWAEEGKGELRPRSWGEACGGWPLDPRSDEALLEAAVSWGQGIVEEHARWLDGLRRLPARVARAPRMSQVGLDVVLTQEWSDDMVRIRAAPAPVASRPQLVVTLRDAEGVIVDLFRLRPARFDGVVAVFEVWLLGRRQGAVAAEVRLG